MSRRDYTSLAIRWTGQLDAPCQYPLSITAASNAGKWCLLHTRPKFQKQQMGQPRLPDCRNGSKCTFASGRLVVFRTGSTHYAPQPATTAREAFTWMQLQRSHGYLCVRFPWAKSGNDLLTQL